MESLEVISDNSLAPHDSIVVVPSSSYNDQVIPGDTGSVTSASLQGTRSPARSPSSSQRNVDLLNGAGQGFPTTRERSGVSSDDDHTDPSSSATGHTGDAGYRRSDLQPKAPTSSFGRLIENTKKRLNSSDRRRSSSDDEEEAEVLKNALIYGYLQKLGRNGKWQSRWFESDGECLTYYKSSKRTKLLATLDLAKVGSIVINHQDRTGTTFTINISDRPYHLRAESMGTCKDWVITLNRVKEARMREGNVKLSLPTDQPPDLLDHNFTPRVVVVANRQRTRAIDDDDIQSWENGATWSANPASDAQTFLPTSTSGRLARWQKPRNSLSRLASKLAKWARSIRKFGSNGCTEVENHVVLDHHLHPPGHDDKPSTAGNSSPSGSKTGPSDAVNSDRSVKIDDVSPAPIVPDDEDDEARYLS